MDSAVLDWHAERKEAHVQNPDSRNTDINPTLELHRDDTPVAVVFCDINAESIIEAARIGIPGYGADEVVMTSDSYRTKSPTTPEGQPWGPGSMQKRFLAGSDQGLVQETLQVVRMTRDGEVEMAQLPYRIDHAERKVLWDERLIDSTAQELVEVGGRIPHALRASFALPNLHHAFGDEMGKLFGLSPERAKLHRDLAVTKVLLGCGFMALIATPSEDWAREVVRESLKDYDAQDLQ